MNHTFKIIQYPDVLDNSKITQFHQEIEEVVKAGVHVILLDFKNISSITSAGLMAVVEAFRLVRSAGCQLFICSLNSQVRMLFELTGLDQIFPTFGSLDEVMGSAMLIKK